MLQKLIAGMRPVRYGSGTRAYLSRQPFMRYVARPRMPAMFRRSLALGWILGATLLPMSVLAEAPSVVVTPPVVLTHVDAVYPRFGLGASQARRRRARGHRRCRRPRDRTSKW